TDTLASVLGLEDDVVVRRSIRDVLIDYTNSVNTKEPDRARLQRVLAQLSQAMVLQNIDFMSAESDICTRPSETKRPLTCETRARLDAVASVLQTLVRKGTPNNNLEGIYCLGCDFSRLKLDGFS